MKNNLKQIRKIKGITQKELAEHLGVSKQVISMWENNPDEKIPDNRVKQIAEFFRVEETDIHTVELDMKQIQKQSLEEEINELWQQYKSTDDPDERSSIDSQIQSLHILEEIQDYNKQIHANLDEMIFDPTPFQQVARFTKVANHHKDYSHDRLINHVLDVLEDDDTRIEKIFIEVIEVLSFIQPDLNYTLKEDPFNGHSKFQKQLEALIQEHFRR